MKLFYCDLQNNLGNERELVDYAQNFTLYLRFSSLVPKTHVLFSQQNISIFRYIYIYTYILIYCMYVLELNSCCISQYTLDQMTSDKSSGD